MRMTSRLPGGLAAAVLAASLAACAPTEVRLDNPKDGVVANLAPEQPMTLRLTNLTPKSGAWALQEGELSAVAFKGRQVRPPADGAMQLEIFEFAGKTPGEDQLTFVYAGPDGAPSDQISFTVAVR